MQITIRLGRDRNLHSKTLISDANASAGALKPGDWGSLTPIFLHKMVFSLFALIYRKKYRRRPFPFARIPEALKMMLQPTGVF